MANDTTKQFTDQIEKTLFGPARTYAALATDHVEALAGIQIEAAKAYYDMSFKQARAALDIRDAEGLQAYVTRQPEVAKEVGDRVKGDAEKFTAANQAFVEKAQKVTQESVDSARKVAEDNVSKAQKATASK